MLTIISVAANFSTDVSAVEQILEDNGFEKAILVGHSFGTNVMSWCVQQIPNKVAGSVWLDPVCFMLHLSKVTFNWFFASAPNLSTEGSSLDRVASGMEGRSTDLDLFGIVKTELFAANAVQRQLSWSRNVLWAQEIQERGSGALVVVSNKDKVVPSAAVAQHIEKHRAQLTPGTKCLVNVECLPDGEHGSLVFNEQTRNHVLEKISLFVDAWNVEECSEKKALNPRTRYEINKTLLTDTRLAQQGSFQNVVRDALRI